MPKVTQLVSGGAGIGTQAACALGFCALQAASDVKGDRVNGAYQL